MSCIVSAHRGRGERGTLCIIYVYTFFSSSLFLSLCSAPIPARRSHVCLCLRVCVFNYVCVCVCAWGISGKCVCVSEYIIFPTSKGRDEILFLFCTRNYFCNSSLLLTTINAGKTKDLSTSKDFPNSYLSRIKNPFGFRTSFIGIFDPGSSRSIMKRALGEGKRKEKRLRINIFSKLQSARAP